MILYHGRGADFWPRSHDVEELLTGALKRAGKSGSRSDGLFASTRRDQAIEYAANRCSDNLFVARPAPGSIVSWAPDHADLMISFEGWMNDRRWERDAGSLQALLSDIAGDIGTLEFYVHRKLQRRKIAAIADFFVRGLTIEEFVVDDDDELLDRLGDHSGEVWITGQCELAQEAVFVPSP